MIRDITIGQYYASDSVIHRLDPRVKIMVTLVYIISLFLFDDFMGYPAGRQAAANAYPQVKDMMKTDIREHDEGYEVDIDLPGFKKDEIKVSLEDGYLTIEAAKGLDEDEQEKKTGKYIRKERYAGACQRSFYVGDNLTQEDIKGEFKHGILTLNVPKKEAKPAVETNKYIAIEG